MPGGLPKGMSGKQVKLNESLWQSVLADSTTSGAVILHVNTSERYRDPDEGLLVITHAPHQVRAPSDSGVRYRIDPSTGKAAIALEGQFQLRQTDAESFQVNSEHVLCQACCDVFGYYCRYMELKSKVGFTDRHAIEFGKLILVSQAERGRQVHISTLTGCCSSFQPLFSARLGYCSQMLPLPNIIGYNPP